MSSAWSTLLRILSQKRALGVTPVEHGCHEVDGEVPNLCVLPRIPCCGVSHTHLSSFEPLYSVGEYLSGWTLNKKKIYSTFFF